MKPPRLTKAQLRRLLWLAQFPVLSTCPRNTERLVRLGYATATRSDLAPGANMMRITPAGRARVRLACGGGR